jgi:hypothetical protein
LGSLHLQAWHLCWVTSKCKRLVAARCKFRQASASLGHLRMGQRSRCDQSLLEPMRVSACPMLALPQLQARLAFHHITQCTPRPLQQPRSGSPGYTPGLPLLAGLLETRPEDGADAIARLPSGLQLPGRGAGGRCSAAAPGMSLTWGYNASSSCSIGLALDQVCAHCCIVQHCLWAAEYEAVKPCTHIALLSRAFLLLPLI